MTADSPHRPAKDHQGFAIAPSVRFARDDDGLVLFDICSGCYSSFNPVGSLVWTQVEAGASTVEIIERVGREFADVPRETIDQDVRAILAQLMDQGLIMVSGDGLGNGDNGDNGDNGVNGLAAHCSSPTTARDVDPDFIQGSAGLLGTLKAFAFLVYIDLLMRLSRFKRVYDTVRDSATNRKGTDSREIGRTCQAMDNAALAYIKKAWCLQRSAACVCLLRRKGVPAELVLGVRTFPFEAHAWVELDGRVLSDQLDYVGRFLVLDRI